MTAIAKLLLPPDTLSGCCFAAVYRDTRGAQLSAQDRLNHFPASPMVAVTRICTGTLYLLGEDMKWEHVQNHQIFAKTSVTPPQDHPITSWASGPVTAITLALYPDAWQALGGSTAYDAVPNSLVRALDQFETAPSPETGWAKLCATLTPHWTDSRPAPWHRATNITDWAKGVITRTALSGRGQSLRSLERRLKRTSGHTRRTLEFFSAMETLQKVAHTNASAPPAEIAHLAGYADQSHMGRAVRRATGFTPARLNQAIQTDEAFWCYRLLGERF